MTTSATPSLPSFLEQSDLSRLPALLPLLERRLEAETKRRADTTKLSRYKPYAKQAEFHAAGLEHRERLLMAGNQLGKTFSGAAELAIHLTGQYPEWWEGRRWDRPVRAWAGSETTDVTRDGAQRMLIGEPKDKSQWGTGAIPKKSINGTNPKRGTPNALDSVMVKHESGGNSTLGFKSYDQGREKWQAETLDIVWFDEEPPQDVFVEGLTRTNATNGMIYLTFTPLLGLSHVVRSFLIDPERGSDDGMADDQRIQQL